MKRKFLHITFIVLTASCHRPDPKNDLIGKWSGYEDDSTYVEIWVNDTLFLNWSERAWSYEIHQYKYDEQTKELRIFEGNQRRTKWKLNVDILEHDSLVLNNEFGSWNFKRISSTKPKIEKNEEVIRKEVEKRK